MEIYIGSTKFCFKETNPNIMDLICEVLDYYEKKNEKDTELIQECFNRIYMAGCIIEPKEFISKLNIFERWAIETNFKLGFSDLKKYPWKQIFEAKEKIKKIYNRPNAEIPPNALEKILFSALINEEKIWSESLFDEIECSQAFYPFPSALWDHLSTFLTPFEVLIQNSERISCEEVTNLPGYKKSNMNPNPLPQKTIPEPYLKPMPQAIPKVKPSPRETITQFITKHKTSINYVQVFIFISHHTKNRFSDRGRKVYPYGQQYVARKLDISLRTVRRIFSWLRRQGIIFKRSNENHNHPDIKQRCATWFVCTSLKQSIYFKDPEGRRPKKRAPRSSRKRHFHGLHT